jgi:hypothetical protein
VNNKEICLEFCCSKDQVADIFTNYLERDGVQHMSSSLGAYIITNV